MTTTNTHTYNNIVVVTCITAFKDSLFNAYTLTIVFHTNNRRSHRQNPFHTAAYRVVECYYLGTREAQAQLRASETTNEES